MNVQLVSPLRQLQNVQAEARSYICLSVAFLSSNLSSESTLVSSPSAARHMTLSLLVSTLFVFLSMAPLMPEVPRRVVSNTISIVSCALMSVSVFFGDYKYATFLLAATMLCVCMKKMAFVFPLLKVLAIFSFAMRMFLSAEHRLANIYLSSICCMLLVANVCELCGGTQKKETQDAESSSSVAKDSVDITVEDLLSLDSSMQLSLILNLTSFWTLICSGLPLATNAIFHMLFMLQTSLMLLRIACASSSMPKYMREMLMLARVLEVINVLCNYANLVNSGLSYKLMILVTSALWRTMGFKLRPVVTLLSEVAGLGIYMALTKFHEPMPAVQLLMLRVALPYVVSHNRSVGMELLKLRQDKNQSDPAWTLGAEQPKVVESEEMLPEGSSGVSKEKSKKRRSEESDWNPAEWVWDSKLMIATPKETQESSSGTEKNLKLEMQQDEEEVTAQDFEVANTSSSSLKMKDSARSSGTIEEGEMSPQPSPLVDTLDHQETPGSSANNSSTEIPDSPNSFQAESDWCQVPKCETPCLTSLSRWYKKFRVCRHHLQAQVVKMEVDGIVSDMRFCQPHRIFHRVKLFSGVSHSCMKAAKKRQVTQVKMSKVLQAVSSPIMSRSNSSELMVQDPHHSTSRVPMRSDLFQNLKSQCASFSSTYCPNAAAANSCSQAMQTIREMQSDWTYTGQTQMVNMHLKMQDTTPATLPSVLRSAVLDTLGGEAGAATPLAMHSYIRPGCVLLSIDLVFEPDVVQEFLAMDGQGLFQSLLRGRAGEFLSNLDLQITVNGNDMGSMWSVHYMNPNHNEHSGAVRRQWPLCHFVPSKSSSAAICPSSSYIPPGQTKHVRLLGRLPVGTGVTVRCEGRMLTASASVTVLSEEERSRTGHETELVVELLSAELAHVTPGLLYVQALLPNGTMSREMPVLLTESEEIAKEIGSLQEWMEQLPEDAPEAQNTDWMTRLVTDMALAQSGEATVAVLTCLVNFSSTWGWPQLTSYLIPKLHNLLSSSAASHNQAAESEEAELKPLQRALLSGSLATVKAILNAPHSLQAILGSPSTLGPRGMTSLHVAACLNDQGAMASLLTNTPQALQHWFALRADDGCTPAEYAAAAHQTRAQEETGESREQVMTAHARVTSKVLRATSLVENLLEENAENGVVCCDFSLDNALQKLEAMQHDLLTTTTTTTTTTQQQHHQCEMNEVEDVEVKEEGIVKAPAREQNVELAEEAILLAKEMIELMLAQFEEFGLDGIDPQFAILFEAESDFESDGEDEEDDLSETADKEEAEEEDNDEQESLDGFVAVGLDNWPMKKPAHEDDPSTWSTNSSSDLSNDSCKKVPHPHPASSAGQEENGGLRELVMNPHARVASKADSAVEEPMSESMMEMLTPKRPKSPKSPLPPAQISTLLDGVATSRTPIRYFTSLCAVVISMLLWLLEHRTNLISVLSTQVFMGELPSCLGWTFHVPTRYVLLIVMCAFMLLSGWFGSLGPSPGLLGLLFSSVTPGTHEATSASNRARALKGGAKEEPVKAGKEGGGEGAVKRPSPLGQSSKGHLPSEELLAGSSQKAK